MCEAYFLSLFEDNPLVIKVMDMFVSGSGMYMMMEYCADGTVEQFLDNLKTEVRAKELDSRACFI